VAETCDSFCTRSGQGHTHFRACNQDLCGNDLHDGVRHNSDQRIAAGHSSPVDEFTHSFYWEAVNIEDPCVESERHAFAKCGNLCASEEHQEARSQVLTVPYTGSDMFLFSLQILCLPAVPGALWRSCRRVNTRLQHS
jgi:hypothetical protein